MAILMALMFLRKIGQTPCWVEAWIASSNRTIKYKCSNMFSKITVRLCHCTQWLKMIPVHIDGHLPSRSQHRLDFKRFYVDITAAYRYSMYIYICVCVYIYIYILLHIYLYVCMYIYIYTFAVLDISLYPQIIQCHHIIPLYSHELLHNLHVMHDMSNSPPFLSYICIYIYCTVLHLHLIEVPFIFRFQARQCSLKAVPLQRWKAYLMHWRDPSRASWLGPRRSEGNMTGHR